MEKFTYDLEISVDILKLYKNYPNGRMFRDAKDFASFIIDNMMYAAKGESSNTYRDYGFTVKAKKRKGNIDSVGK